MQLRFLWCARLLKLRKAGWVFAQPANNFDHMRFCPPFGVVRLDAGKRQHPCHKWRICPFCYGRKVEDIYDRFDRFRKENPIDGLDLAEWRFSVEFPYDEWDVHKLFDKVNDVRFEEHRYFKSVGLTFMFGVEPADECWVVRKRVLAILHSSASDLDDSSKTDSWKVIYRRSPFPRAGSGGDFLYKSIARVFRYPVNMISGPARCVAEVLNASEGKLWIQQYGKMRSSDRK